MSRPNRPGLTLTGVIFQGFGPGALRFYEELADNNTRDWWLANKAWYESDVRAPLEHLLADLAPEFGEAKVFRPNRDTRFSADKSPYKTAAAAVIHGDAGAWYLQLSADGLMVGGGTYMPAKDQLARLREAIADDRTGAELSDIVARLGKAEMDIDARETLKTAPRGYPPDHPRIQLLRMKGLVAFARHGSAPWLHTAAARDKVADHWRALNPLNDWLDRHVGRSTEPPRR